MALVQVYLVNSAGFFGGGFAKFGSFSFASVLAKMLLC